MTGVIYALSACFIWGLIFVVPIFMQGYGPMEIALGRYLFYGVISAFVFLKRRCRYPMAIWLKALYFSLASSFAYYTFVILAVRFASPAICALILGLSPITIALYGNWREKECSYRSLIIPSVLILVGLFMINIPHLNHDASAHMLGILYASFALLSWSWYVVANSRFLKKHPEVNSGDWSILLGVGTLVWVGVFAFTGDFSGGEKFTQFSFLGGCAILGILCSWVGTYLWNRASFLLPVALAGQLTIFETIFGILFFYALQQSLPPALECAGIVLFLIAVLWAMRASDSKILEKN